MYHLIIMTNNAVTATFNLPGNAQLSISGGGLPDVNANLCDIYADIQDKSEMSDTIGDKIREACEIERRQYNKDISQITTERDRLKEKVRRVVEENTAYRKVFGFQAESILKHIVEQRGIQEVISVLGEDGLLRAINDKSIRVFIKNATPVWSDELDGYINPYTDMLVVGRAEAIL